MIDEAQDINECQASITLLTTRRTQVRICRHPLTIVPANTKYYLIGDPYQSIFIFRGASQALEKAIDSLPGGTSSQALCTLSASHRFGSNIAAVDSTYVKNSLKFSQQARYARIYNKTAVPVPYDAPPIHGASYFAGIIHNSTSAELRPPYTVLCMTNKGVLEAGFRLLGMSELTDNTSASTATATATTSPISQPSSSSSTRTGVTGRTRMRFHIIAKNRDRYVQDKIVSNIPQKTDFEKMLDKITELREGALGRGNCLKIQDTECRTLEQVEALSDDLDDPNLGDRCRIVRKLMTVSDARFAIIMAGLKAAQTDDMKSADVIVCTAHFAKGSEWDRVQLHSDLVDPLEPVLSDETTLPDCTCGAKQDFRTRVQQQQATRPHFISSSSSKAAAASIPAAVSLCIGCRVHAQPFDTPPADHWRRFKLSILDAQAANLLHVALTHPKRELRLNSAMDRFLECTST
jgi:UvrD/REP helicase N-terminal domain